MLQQKDSVSFSTVLSVLLLSLPLSLSLSLSLNEMITTAVQRIGSEVVFQRRLEKVSHSFPEVQIRKEIESGLREVLSQRRVGPECRRENGGSCR